MLGDLGLGSRGQEAIDAERRDARRDARRCRETAAQTDERGLSRRARPRELGEQASASGSPAARGAARCDAARASPSSLGSRRPKSPVAVSRARSTAAIARSPIPACAWSPSSAAVAASGVARSWRWPDRRATKSGAGVAVGEMRLRLAFLVGVREAGDVGLQDRLAVRAPFAPLDRSHLLGQLVDAPADLLAVGPRREVRDEAADLFGIQPPAVAQEHHRAPARRQRREQVAGQPGAFGADRDLVGCRGVIRDSAHELKRGGRLSPAPSQLTACLIRNRGEHIASNFVVGRGRPAGRRALSGRRPTRPSKCRRSRRPKTRRERPGAPSPSPDPRTRRTAVLIGPASARPRHRGPAWRLHSWMPTTPSSRFPDHTSPGLNRTPPYRSIRLRHRSRSYEPIRRSRAGCPSSIR